MKLIVGLGNPGREYEFTRHNAGFLLLDKIQNSNVKIPFDPAQGRQNFKENNKFEAEILKLNITSEKIVLAKPQTFMNKSGEAVQKICQFYKIVPEDVWVVCDDINLELGQIRIRKTGNDGGHNGLKSVIMTIGENFWRIRIGVGSNKKAISDQQSAISIPAEDYVLQKFNDAEQKIIAKAIDVTADLLIQSISSGIKEETIKINEN